tara:strand:- start:8493 stop:8681 length:189 start_codon:yes stop_codon:yes gene_type:complete
MRFLVGCEVFKSKFEKLKANYQKTDCSAIGFEASRKNSRSYGLEIKTTFGFAPLVAAPAAPT